MSGRLFQQILRDHGDRFIGSDQQKRILRAIMQCQTADAGIHVRHCLACDHAEVRFNSCRNRHCPLCQGAEQAAWVRAREAELLPIPYFHLVCTLPQELRFLRDCAPAVIGDILMRCAAQAVQDLCADPRHLGATVGILSVLHTWGGDLQVHPHVHSIVTGGGLDAAGQWRHCPINRKKKCPFLLPVAVLRSRYRGLVLKSLRQAYADGAFDAAADDGHPDLATRVSFNTLLGRIGKKQWNVYIKEPFGSPQQVLRYLGRYTHRVALDPERIIAYDGEMVRVRCKDHRRGGAWTERCWSAGHFIARFAQHILPPYFRKIRQSGLWGPRVRAERLAAARRALEGNPAPRLRGYRASATPEPLPPPSQPSCPQCGSTTDYHVAHIWRYTRTGESREIIPQPYLNAVRQRAQMPETYGPPLLTLRE